MNKPSWLRPEDGVGDTRLESQPALLVSLHFLVAALRRRWVACVAVAIAGVLLAATYLLVFPPSNEAKTTLILSHDPQLDPTRAMATDVALLDTRTVAAETIRSLGLDMAPEDFQGTLTVNPISSELLSIELKAPSGDEAIRRLNALSATYLSFRAEQLTLQSDSTVQGLQKQIDQLNQQVKILSKRIELLSSKASDSSELGDAISQRASAQSRIDTLQQGIEDAELKTSSIVASSRVVDPAAVEPGLALRGLVLGLASGLIGGLALACGIVLFFAIVSDRIRRRSDVAEAIGAPVIVSVGILSPPWKLWQRLPPMRRIERRRMADRERLAHAITANLDLSSRRSIVVACVDNSAEVSHALGVAMGELTTRGQSTAVVDLTDEGVVDPASVGDGASLATTLRPKGVPALASGWSDLVVLGASHEADAVKYETSDLVVVLADMDPAVGADHLRHWSDQVLVVVTAGRSSAERLRTVGDLIRSAQLDLFAAAIIHAEGSDDSSGIVAAAHPVAGKQAHGNPPSILRSEAR